VPEYQTHQQYADGRSERREADLDMANQQTQAQYHEYQHQWAVGQQLVEINFYKNLFV
jgi:hypothetical protein